MKKNIFIFAVIFTLLACCKKTPPRPELLLDATIKDYNVFQINSFWVYTNENTLQKDTLKIIKSELWGRYDKALYYNYQMYDATYYSTYHKKNIGSRTEARHMDENFCNHNIWFEEIRTSAKCTFFSNRSVGSTYNYWFYPDNIVTYQEFLPTYTLEGKTYNEVMVFESRYTGASLAFDDVRLPVRVWYAKHIGIIRKEMQNGDFWNLIDYNVKQ